MRVLFSPFSRGRGFMRSRRGSFAMLAGLMGSLVFGIGMFAFEAARIDRARNNLQHAADAAAIAAARELPILGGSSAAMEAVARAIAESNLGIVSTSPAPGTPSSDPSASATAGGDGPAGSGDTGISLETAARRLPDSNAVRVDLRHRLPLVFGQIVNVDNPWIVASATAEVHGETKICVVTLNDTESDGIKMVTGSRISAGTCSVFVNSRDPAALLVDDAALIDAQTICTSGGYVGAASNFVVPPTTDCPPRPDPLSGRNVAPDTACTYNERVIIGDDFVTGIFGDRISSAETRSIDGYSPWIVLRPGVYCGGIEVVGTGAVWFEPGTYVVADDTFTVKDDTRVRGDNVAFHFTGANGRLEVLDRAELRYSAPVAGRLAGILLYRKDGVGCAGSGGGGCVVATEHLLRSANVKELIGTIYLPDDKLSIFADQDVASESAFTIVIVGQLEMTGEPNLVLNTHYAATDVPVPDGIHVPKDTVRLRH